MNKHLVSIPYDDLITLIEHDTQFRILFDAHCQKKYGIPNDLADMVFGFEHGCDYKEENKNAE